ncbi:YHS domain-containing (seleno)protein [Roseovarius pelagicus]|uniref:YHS domain-containing protein n=1 Tax=Roseovarius pelagicus TaxID=2980108 RepID=A0ABY6DCG2_9RHOB|nr:YHS domain-containing (seleno)protein [Roseovarius pelagicus]UXX82693.1 YHS domain-containing protein [Roseovarius pelagicus]
MLTRRFLLATAASLPLGIVLPLLPAFAGKDRYFTHDGAAIGGYDPVAYFTQMKPVKGDTAHALSWDGAEWHFASAANKAMFEENPEKYAPQYGGYCAYAVSKGYTAKTEPDAWTVHDGRLYLNYDKSVRRIWERDTSGYISRANENWPAVLN